MNHAEHIEIIKRMANEIKTLDPEGYEKVTKLFQELECKFVMGTDVINGSEAIIINRKNKKLVRISDEELKRFDDMISQNKSIDEKKYSSVYELLNDKTKFLSPEEAEKKFKWNRLPEFKIENHFYQCMHTGQVFLFNSYFKGQIFKWAHNDNFKAFAVSAEKKDDSPYFWHGWKGNKTLAYFHNAEDAIAWNKLKFNW